VAAGGLALAAAPAFAFPTQGVSDNEIVIGSHEDLSGPIKTWGVPAANGMKLAVEEINAAGGINGRKLRLIIEDSGYDPKKAVLATQKLIERDKVFAIVSAMGSATTLAPLPIVQRAGMLHLFPITAAEFTYKMDPAKPEDRLKFNIFVPYYDTMRIGIKWAADNLKKKNICIVYQDDEMGKNFVDAYKDQVEALGLKQGTTVSFKRGATDFSSQVAKMKSEGCELVALGSVVRESVGIVTTARKLGWNPEFVCSTPSYVPDLPELGKEAVEGVYCVGQTEIPHEETATPRVKEWLAAYKKMFSIDANPQVIAGYNGIHAFAFYAAAAGKNLTTDSMLAAMESGKEFHDIFGSPAIRFSKTDHLGAASALVAQVKNGKWQTLAKDQKYK
jgi:ABC-type branched-subunit amino acid transport system substrate-binding protein